MPLNLDIVKYYANLNENRVLTKSIDSEVLEEVVRLIEDEQLDLGIDADGDIIGRYSVATEIITGGEKRAGDPFDLRDTGEFRDSIKAVLVNTGNSFYIQIDADAEKEGGDNLFDLYGSRIINITAENRGYLIEQIKDNAIRILRERR